MGAKLTTEQEGLLQNYRETVLELFDVAMTNTTIEHTHVSFERVKLARQQLEALNSGLLVVFAKAWLKGCLIMKDMDRANAEEEIDHFVERLQNAKVSLPNNGNATDIYNIVLPLSRIEKTRIVKLFYCSIDYLSQIDIPELKL